MRLRWLPFLAVALALAAEGCSWPEPYVYRYREFDRSLATFGKEPADVAAVGICYNKSNATPEQVTEMAKSECAKYGKVARFKEQRRLECPIATPMEAIFTCERQPAVSQWPYSPSPLSP